MLSSISWHQYIATVVTLTASYYLYIVLRYYQKEIANLFHSKPQAPGLISFVQTSPVSVMGRAEADHGVMVSEADNLPFADVLPDDPDDNISGPIHAEINTIYPSSELIAEAGKLIEAFADVANKQEFITLMGILVSSYQRFQEQIDLQATLRSIIEIANSKLKFTVALSDFQNSQA